MKKILIAVVRCDRLEPLKQWFPLISPTRLEKLNRLKLEKDKKMSAGAELALLASLKTAGVGAAEPLYSYDPHGKPILDLPGKYISLAHSGGLAVCALADFPVGVDIETPRIISAAVARMLLSPDEGPAYTTGYISDDELLARWTVMESYFKLTGEGIDRRAITSMSVKDGIVVRNGETAASYSTITLNNPKCIISCSAYDHASICTHIFTPDELGRLLGC